MKQRTLSVTDAGYLFTELDVEAERDLVSRVEINGEFLRILFWLSGNVQLATRSEVSRNSGFVRDRLNLRLLVSVIARFCRVVHGDDFLRNISLPRNT